MSGAITAIATAASAAAANAAAFAGASSAVIEGVSSITYAVVAAGLPLGISTGIGAALAPKLPGPTDLQFPLKQAMTERVSATGTVRVSGPYALYTVGATHKNFSYDVQAHLDGESDAWVAHYLNDDLMAPYGNGYWYAPGALGKYGGGGSNPPNLVQIDYRLGVTPETAYAISADVPEWTSTHRGDGVTSTLLTCIEARREDQAGDFPNGLPQLSSVWRAQKLYDPRDAGQTQGDKSTYLWSDNPVLGLLGYLTDAKGGMGLDYVRFILPTVDYWKAAADECDGLVSTSGMHATLLDAAAAGDAKIFVADQTGLAAGVQITLLDGQVVTVSGLATGGEVDLTGTLDHPHAAGELAYWNATGQQARYRCNAVYKHSAPPGDVIKGYLQSFDGWMMPRGDGALVVRTNTLYAPTVTLEDRHIVGYQIQNYLPDEQATNQYIVSYTDPASAYNKQEAGYVQDDIDIAARGVPRSQALDLPWVPSPPQATAIARAMLARQSQTVRGVITCNLAGLAVMGERYVKVQITEQPALADAIVEITGKVSINLQALQVSFPFVAVGNRANGASQALCFILDISNTIEAGVIAKMKTGVVNALLLIASTYGAGLDLCVVASNSDTTTSYTKRSASASDIMDLIADVEAITTSPTTYLFDAEAALTAAKTFFDATDVSITTRRTIFVWDGVPDTASGDPATFPANIAAAQAVIAGMTGVSINMINIEFTDTSWAAELDNTPDDGVPVAPTADDLTRYIEQAVFGSSSSPGAGYTLPTLAPPSGSPLQPLTAPTISSVTPVYPNSGGGVQGARASIVVADPGGNITWKVQWKLSADSAWTDAGSSYTATGTPLTILTGLIPATGSVDFQVAYIAGSQVSPWSATDTETIAAAVGVVASTSKSASFTTTSDKNVYYVDTSGGAVTVTLNASPAANETVEVWDSTGHAGTNPISLNGNGKNIAGVASVSNAVQINYGKIKLTYTGTQWLAA